MLKKIWNEIIFPKNRNQQSKNVRKKDDKNIVSIAPKENKKKEPLPNHVLTYKASKYIHDNQPCVVFDLDLTVVSAFECDWYYTQRIADSDLRCFQSNGLDYDYKIYDPYNSKFYHWKHFFNPGFYEILKWLDLKNVLVDFYSRGDSSRNKKLVKFVFDTIHQNSSREKYRASRFWDDTDFRRKNKKSLSSLNYDLNNTVIIDDKKSNCAKGEEANFFEVLPAYHTDFEEIIEGGYNEAKVLFTERKADFMATNHIFYMACILNHALMLEKNNQQSFRSGLGIALKQFAVDDFTSYENGLSILKMVNKNLQLFCGADSLVRYHYDPQKIAVTESKSDLLSASIFKTNSSPEVLTVNCPSVEAGKQPMRKSC